MENFSTIRVCINGEYKKVLVYLYDGINKKWQLTTPFLYKKGWKPCGE